MFSLGVAHIQTERGGYQWCVSLDVRTKHQDVAWLEGLIIGKQADKELAEHLDLAVRPV
jgi:hypothetical protein